MIDAVILRRQEEALGICSFELAASDGSSLPAFEPGAHIDVHLDEGKIRQYSLCSLPKFEGRYLIGVLRDPGSRGGSVAMHALKPGDRLRIGEPRNLFPLAMDAQRTLLFAGGIGITPLLSMAEHLALRGQAFTLHYCARSSGHMAFRDRIKNGVVGKRAAFHFDDGEASQRLDLEKALGRPEPATHIYVCGPAGFMDWVLAGARNLAWPEPQLHKEYFAAPASTHEPGGAFELRLQRTGRTLHVAAGVRVIDVLVEHGIEVPVSCEQGVCGTCLTRVTGGVPDHRDAFLTDEERKRNDCFTPCCSRAHSAELVVDL